MRDLLVKIALRLGIYQQLVECINRVKFEVQARRMRRDGLKMLAAAQEVFDHMHVRAFLTGHGTFCCEAQALPGGARASLVADVGSLVEVHRFLAAVASSAVEHGL